MPIVRVQTIPPTDPPRRRGDRAPEYAGAVSDGQDRAAGPRALEVIVVETLVNAMEAKDPFLRGHSQRVASLAGAIAAELGLSSGDADAIRLAGRIHDVGKIGIRESVLHKRGPLTAAEREHIRTHVAIGVEILAPLRQLGVVLDYVHHHHEQLDGSGYPHHLRGAEISPGGRILAVADVFDALTSRRPYREPFSVVYALAAMRELAGSKLDPDAFAALSALIARGYSVARLPETEQ
jgi:putative nucleotidyltransferase with HDIG domain